MWRFQSRFRPLIPHQHSTMPRSWFRMVQIQTGDVILVVFSPSSRKRSQNTFPNWSSLQKIPLPASRHGIFIRYPASACAYFKLNTTFTKPSECWTLDRFMRWSKIKFRKRPAVNCCASDRREDMADICTVTFRLGFCRVLGICVMRSSNDKLSYCLWSVLHRDWIKSFLAVSEPEL